MRKPSITFLNRVYPPARGASGRVLRDLARAFVRDGWNVTVITTGTEAVRERDGAIRVIRVKAKGKSSWSYGVAWLKIFFKALSLPAPDVVVTLTDPPLLVVAGALLQKFKKTKHVHWCHDLYPELFPVLGYKMPPVVFGFFQRQATKAIKACDKVVVIGRCMAKTLTHKGVKPGKMTVIPNWANEGLVEKSPQGSKPGGPEALEAAAQVAQIEAAMEHSVEGARPSNELRRSVDPKFRVLYAGSLGRAHPLRTIVEAARILDKRNPEIEFVFVGEGPQFDWLAKEREKLSLQNIRLLPWQPESRVRDVMESGDLHLISMRNGTEGLLVPCKLYSALAVGRPCILVGPDDTEAAQILADFKAGKRVDQGAADALAKAVLSYRLDGEEWFKAHEGAVKAGGVFVPEESWTVWTDRMRALLDLPKEQGVKASAEKRAA